MKSVSAWSLVVCAGGSVVAAAAIGLAVGQESSIASGDQNAMQTGVTVTQPAPTNAPLVEKAVPSITGPAPLPVEDQGLPG
ncbi:MAG: hypothetical protein JWR11_3090 [Mycobacterium sp.]|jgi:hypothetical protein|nr:hypothetical protein [Mycobacterium sp.]MDT5180476.1 hypothetical protein [Mycobacterium sp.]